MVNIYPDTQSRALAIIDVLRKVTKDMQKPGAVEIIKVYGKDPFLVLVSCILSLRTKDTVSVSASKRLFEHARKPHELMRLSLLEIQKLIYPVGFYRQKAQQLVELSARIVHHFNGVVPCGESDLLSLPGVGRKTMNLVQAEGFGMPALCVDTHVHRISNRLRLVQTSTPQETEYALKALLPQAYWIEYSRLLVTWGQNICTPTLPHCSVCPLAPVCPQIGVIRKR
ncbi:MAG: endonuclease III [Candidatus Dependentiae bacterium]|nr:endonuclease III [Candidatus Dependentiae bacterium]